MSGRPTLSAKERAFVAAYPVSLCAAKAARKAGYAAKYAGTQGKQLTLAEDDDELNREVLAILRRLRAQ